MKRLYLFCFLTLSAWVVNANPTEGLVGHYPFNGNANDKSKHQNHATIAGATLTSDRHGEKSSAYQFGKDASVKINISNWKLDSASSHSISLWVFYESLSSQYNTVFTTKGCGNFAHELAFNKNESKIHMNTGVHCLSWDARIKAAQPTLGKWDHYTFVYENHTSSLFINGELAGSAEYNNSHAPPAPILHLGGNSSKNYFSGKLDDVYVYNRALSQNEIKALYNPLHVSLKSLYHHRQPVPTGFSMLSIPFSYRGNTARALFGQNPDITIYDYNYFGGWVLNSYDAEFDEWDIPNHVLPAGTAIWVLNRGASTLHLQFQGEIPSQWRFVNEAQGPE